MTLYGIPFPLVNGIPLRTSVSMPSMTTIGDRIRAEREAQGITRPDLARSAGISPTTLSDLELGRSKSTTALHKIAVRLGVSVNWLETGRGNRREELGEDLDAVGIPAYAHHLALGDGASAEDFSETHRLMFRRTSLRKKGLHNRPLEVYYGRGDSMEPRIKDGDALMVDRSDVEPRDDTIFVLESEEGAVAKRLSEIGGRWFVVSDNKQDPKWRKPVALDGKKPFKIVGRVRWIGSWED